MFDVDKMYVIIKKLVKSKGKLQVEKYLNDDNSTTEERKLAYASRSDKGKAIKNEYKGQIKDIGVEIKKLTRLSIDEIGEELDFLESDLSDVKNDLVKDLQLDGKAVTKEEYIDELNKEIADLYKQLSVLNNKSTNEVDSESVKEVVELRNKRSKLITERDSKILETISDEEFNKIPIPQQNTKGARDNEKLDVLMGIYQNPYTAKDIMTPGGYSSIAAIAKEFNGDIKPPKDIFGVEAMDNMTIQNIQGRDLKGIAANHNSHTSKRQWSKLKLSFPALFDGQKLDNLHDKIAHSVSGEKRTITRNFAEILAASVDNGKDPLLASINYNQHTADVISLLIATGADLKTVFAFINQPVIKQAVELVNLGEQRDLMSALKSIAKDRKISTKEVDLKITNFNQADLLSTLKGDKNISNEANILQSMIKYMAASKDFSNLIAASKADTKGIGKFMEEGITLMRNIKKALTLKNIQNTEEFLKGNNEEVIDGDKPIDQRFNNMFAKYGVELPINEIMSKIYPYINESFSGIKDVIEQNLGYSMTADEARLVDSMLVQFHSSKFDWYANENKFELVKKVPVDLQSIKADYTEFTQSDEVKPLFDALTVGTDDRLGMDIIEFDNTQTASDEQRTDIKKAWASLSKPYAEQLLTERLLKDNLLTPEELVTLQLDGKSFNNLKAIQELKKLDKFNNPEVQKLIQDYLLDRFANNLIRYSFYTTGLNFTPKSISSLIPIGMYTDVSYNGTSMSDMVYGIQNMPNAGTREVETIDGITTEVDDKSDASRFIDQFYKHMAGNPKFVPKAKFDVNDTDGKNNITSVDEKVITIARKGDDTIGGDLYTIDKDGYMVPVSKYISIRVDGKDRLYRNVNSSSNTQLVFNRVNTLGANGLIYEFDNSGGDISIIPGNNIVEATKEVEAPTAAQIEETINNCIGK